MHIGFNLRATLVASLAAVRRNFVKQLSLYCSGGLAGGACGGSETFRDPHGLLASLSEGGV